MSKYTPHYSLLDRICLSFDQALKTISNQAENTGAANPSAELAPGDLSRVEQKHAAGIMRVNHAGEVCAQALYHGQGLVARQSTLQAALRTAAKEEGDHLTWTAARIAELGSHVSYLNPFWYTGSFMIGMVAGALGDQWSLGFVVETEKQVIEHLARQRGRLPASDARSMAILEKMEQDEAKHRDEALAAGAKELPGIVRKMMAMAANVMVKSAYWL